MVDSTGILKARLGLLQEIMNLRLQIIRKSHQHSGNKGANAEQIVRDLLREYLPPSYRIGHGEVIDRKGGISREIDVVITNEYHPFLNDLAYPSVFICEGVASAGEVKTVLTTEGLENSLDGALAFKSLEFWLQQGTTAFTNHEDTGRFIKSRPYFLFAFESQLSLKAIKEKVDSWSTANSVPLNHQLDAVFLLSEGALVNIGTGQGSLTLERHGGLLQGFQPVFSTDTILVNFMSWLSATMLRITLPSSPVLPYLTRMKGA